MRPGVGPRRFGGRDPWKRVVSPPVESLTPRGVCLPRLLGDVTCQQRDREFFVDNLLVQIHSMIEMIRWTGLAPWEFEFPFPGSFTSTFLGPVSKNPMLNILWHYLPD